jgi:hypothetical protein
VEDLLPPYLKTLLVSQNLSNLPYFYQPLVSQEEQQKFTGNEGNASVYLSP